MSFLLGYVLGSRTAATVSHAAAQAVQHGASEEKVRDVDDRIDRLLLIVSAMWELLEETGMTEERLVAKMEEIAAVEEAERANPIRCRQCDARVPTDADACQFCGKPTGLERSEGPLDEV